MLKLYAEIAALAARRAARSWLAAVSIPVYVFAVMLAAQLVAPLGMIGGMIIGVVAAACLGAYLSLLGAAVSGSPIRLADLKNGLRALWDVMSVGFALWIISLLVKVLVGAAGDKGPAVAGVFSLAVAIFLNVVPELIYNSRNRSFALLKESASWIMANPFAWFPPNLVFAFAFLWAVGALSFSSPGELLVRLAALGSGGVLGLAAGAPLWKVPLLIVFLHYVMVFRGLLYRELSTGSRRMRDFQRRAGA
jgi:hypothetical protein